MSSRGRHVHPRKQKPRDDWSVTTGRGHPGGALSLCLQGEGQWSHLHRGQPLLCLHGQSAPPMQEPKEPKLAVPCVQGRPLLATMHPAFVWFPESGLRLHRWCCGPVAPGSTAPRAASGTERYQMASCCSVATFCLRLSLLCCVPPNYILKP